MKINDRHPLPSTGVGGPAAPRPRAEGAPEARPTTAQPTPAPASAPASAPATKVELSARSRELHEARRLADAAPDVRADKVADVRARITDGTYKVDPHQIAQRIVDRRA
jgi:negative regulator of flagellin synthesis FlgM